jgi:hypothetical protein
MTLHLLKLHLQTFLSIPITQKCQILSCDTFVANEPCALLTFSANVPNEHMYSNVRVMLDNYLIRFHYFILNFIFFIARFLFTYARHCIIYTEVWSKDCLA